MISEGVDSNGVHRDEVNGLMVAMDEGNTEVVRILLGCNNIKIDTNNSDGWTALHYACEYNRVECVQLFLAHNICTKDIVRIESHGVTAEMMANHMGNYECARLVREYLENNDDTDGDRNEETQLENLTLTEVAKRIEDMNANESLLKAKMKDDQKKELEKLETEYKRKRNDTLEKHNVAQKKELEKLETEYKRKRN